MVTVNKKKSLEGVWAANLYKTDDYHLDYIIRQVVDGYAVYVEDFCDGEKLQISDVMWDGETLSFKSFMRSTQRTAFHQFTLKKKDSISSKFTFTEPKKLKRPKGYLIKNKQLPIEGVWVSTWPHDESDYNIKYVISRVGRRLAIKMKDFHDGETFEISNVKQDGNNSLSFISFCPSTKRSVFNCLKLISKGKIINNFTFSVSEELRRIDKKILRQRYPHSPRTYQNACKAYELT